MMSKWIAGLAALVLSAAPLMAEELDYFLVDTLSYDPAIPKPDVYIPQNLGEQPVRHDQLVAYLRAVAAASDRITIETAGYSHEGRPILFMVVTDPANHQRLEDIRTAHLARTSWDEDGPSNTDTPVITWVNYGVHGAESSGMDAVIPTLYTLAAGQGEELDAVLKNSVILITAVFNPDGHNRRASWVTQYGSNIVATDPAHEVHHHYWPGGRTNHYWFDLNRQWLLQTQPESRAWLSKWHRWKPNVSADMHEMGAESTYYFHPGVPTRKYPLIPARGRELLVKIADFHRAYFDEEKKLYFSEEGFDNFYVGKGSTYPQVNGGLGILFEAGAQLGIARESRQGIKTYANNVRNHHRTSLTTIFGASALKDDLQAYQAEFFQSARELARRDDVKGYVFQAPEDPARLTAFLDLLARHDVDAYALDGELRAGGKTYGAGAYIVPLEQDQYRMAKAMFNRITDFEDKVFYDVSGWTLPLAYGLDYAPVTGRLTGRLGAAAEVALPAGRAPEDVPYAYVLRWSDLYAPRAVNTLLEAGLKARVAINPIDLQTPAGTVSFERGAIIVPLEYQPLENAAIHRLMQQVATDNHITVYGASSGHTLNPGTDLGGRNSIRDLAPLNPLMVVGPGFSPYDAGEVWHLLDERMGIKLTIVRHERLASVDLNRYSHIILPGSFRNAPAALNVHTERFKRWQRAGGTVIAMRHAANWAAERLSGSEDKDEATDSPRRERLAYSAKPQKDAEQVIGGAVFASDLDITHPLGFGFVRRTIATHRNTTLTLPVPKDPYAQVAVYTDTPLLSGYASTERLSELAGTPMLTAERIGRGALILFADDPNFRATYRGAEKLFLNALFFSTAFNAAGRRSDDAHAE